MTKRLLIAVFILWATHIFAQDIPAKPNPPRLVNDFVGNVLSQAEIETLEQKLVNYNDTTSTQIIVVIVATIGDYDMNTYATKIGREWGVGSADFNNGIVLLWATEDRKVYIATGYGMEGALPDIYAKRIVEQIIIPYFRNGEYYNGLNEASSAIIKYAAGEYEASPESSDEMPLWLLILILLIIYLIIRSIIKNSKNGGGRNGGFPYTTYTGWGRQSGNWGGWSGGGSSWGGGGGWSGGGFGGFGGGSFGGGGAGGSY